MASKKLPRTECKGGGRILWSTGSPVFIAGSTLVLLAPSSASSGAQASTLPWRVNLNRPCEGSWRKVDKMATKQIGPCEAIRDGKTCGETHEQTETLACVDESTRPLCSVRHAEKLQ